MEFFTTAFETVAVGAFSFIWIVLLIDLLTPSTGILDYFNRIVNQISSNKDGGGIAATSIGILLLPIFYFLGVTVFYSSNQIYENDLFIIESNDQITYNVYRENVDKVLNTNFSKTIIDQINSLKEVAKSDGILSDSERLKILKEVEDIYEYQQHYVIANSEKGQILLERIRSELTILRGNSVNFFILFFVVIFWLARRYLVFKWIYKYFKNRKKTKELVRRLRSIISTNKRRSRRIYHGVLDLMALLIIPLITLTSILGSESSQKDYDKSVISLYSAISPKVSSNAWNRIPIGDIKGGEINAFIEATKGSSVKMEIDISNGNLMFDRRLKKKFIANYGAIPQTIGGDLEPLDIIVWSKDSIASNQLIRVKLLGVIKMFDRGQKDDKIVARPIGELGKKPFIRDHEWRKIGEWFAQEASEGTSRIVEIIKDPDAALDHVSKSNMNWNVFSHIN